MNSAATLDRLQRSVAVVDDLIVALRRSVAGQVRADGRVDRTLLDDHQHVAHALTWYATYAEAVCGLAEWMCGLAGKEGAIEAGIVDVVLDEYLAQMLGGIAMSQTEVARPSDFDCPAGTFAALSALVSERDAATRRLARAALAGQLERAQGGTTLERTGLDEDLEMIRDQFYDFAAARVSPFAQRWHADDALIPIELVEELGALGVFGLTIPASHVGSGLGKLAMCIVSEELSRGYIGVGSLGTRSEIAGELILHYGTSWQRDRWLPGIATGAILPTAVFTEPATGSDLGAITTRAASMAGGYAISGNKTWITHAARADLMLVLARTEPGSGDHQGLSIFVCEKARGTGSDPFPAAGLSGTEIGVIGYRGMKEYELAFDDFAVPSENLLGGVAGQGFRQLMTTFESARIQTAARAIGVAQNAYDLALRYAQDRLQFGQPIFAFPRISDKLAMMAAEIAAVRQLTYRAARKKDAGVRCDLEAGMAKLLAARTAWSAADCAVQIHGGNGFATEFPISRILCDARILSIFEGAAEIQAQVIARRLLEQG